MKPSLTKLIFFWLMVAAPLGWGVYQSAKKSLPLFQQAPAPAPR